MTTFFCHPKYTVLTSLQLKGSVITWASKKLLWPIRKDRMRLIDKIRAKLIKPGPIQDSAPAVFLEEQGSETPLVIVDRPEEEKKIVHVKGRPKLLWNRKKSS